VFKRISRLIIVALFIPWLGAASGPNFTLKDLGGREHNVNEFIGQGKWVVAAIWSADCPICRREIYHMTFFHEEHSKTDAVVLGVSVDGYANKEKARGFIEDQGLNFPNLIGEPADVSRFGGGAFIGTPTYYFFSPDGLFMKTHVGAISQEQAEHVIRSLSNQIPKT
jgi:thiol-disulfide isomerase/thioredoxin